MKTIGGIGWALTFGLAVCLIAGGVAIVGTTAAPTPAATHEMATGTDIAIEPWPTSDTLAAEVARDATPDDAGNVTIILAARWGYLNDSFAALHGEWRFNATRTGGEFQGEWHLAGARIGGTLQGRFTLPPSGDGEFRGAWSSGGARGGFLSGAWTRVDDSHGSFRGRWNFTNGRPGGVLAGMWGRPSEPAGGFRGYAVAAPTIDPVNWNGFLNTTDGAVRVLRTVRFERGDMILPRTDRQTVAWNSTTTVNWDGIIFILRLPRGDPGPTVTLNTTQIQLSWTEQELARLHVRTQVDAAGHAIEVASFLVDRHPGYARIQIGMRWGNLSSTDGVDASGGTATTWNGFAQVTYGALAVERVLSFERGDAVLPRDNRVTVVWQSSTTTGWDGLLIVAVVPLAHADSTYFTVHAGSFTHVFALGELPGDHVFDAGSGNQVELRAVRG